MTSVGSGSEAIRSFWSWWSRGGAGWLDDVFSGRADGDVVAEVGPRVEAIAPGLEWELGPGSDSRHVLTVTAAGNPDLRGAARRWLEAAPAADGSWSFVEFRQPTPDLPISMGGQTYAVDEALAVARPGVGVVDVFLYHPSFPMEGHGGPSVRQVGYLLLDAALGEEAVETWVGGIEFVTTPPEGAQPLRSLADVVADVAARFAPVDGEPQWRLLQGDTESGPAIAMVRPPLSALVDPAKEVYVEVRVPFADVTEQGFPGPGSFDALGALEDAVEGAVGTRGRMVAVETCAGVRSFHVYVEPDQSFVQAVEKVVRGWDQGEVNLSATLDPGWGAVRHLKVRASVEGVGAITVIQPLDASRLTARVAAGRADSAEDGSQERVDAEFHAIVTDLAGAPPELIDPETGQVAGRVTSTSWGRRLSIGNPGPRGHNYWSSNGSLSIGRIRCKDGRNFVRQYCRVVRARLQMSE